MNKFSFNYLKNTLCVDTKKDEISAARRYTELAKKINTRGDLIYLAKKQKSGIRLNPCSLADLLAGFHGMHAQPSDKFMRIANSVLDEKKNLNEKLSDIFSVRLRADIVMIFGN